MGYFDCALKPDARNKLVDMSMELFKKELKHIDAIAVQGMSGCSFGAVLAYQFDLPLLVVLKDADRSHDDSTHRYSDIVPDYNCPVYQNVLIVDDFISSGATTERIYKRLTKHGHNVAAVLLYSSHDRESRNFESESGAVKTVPIYAMEI